MRLEWLTGPWLKWQIWVRAYILSGLSKVFLAKECAGHVRVENEKQSRWDLSGKVFVLHIMSDL